MNESLYNNPDSFAMAFDKAWKELNSSKTNRLLSKEEKLKIVLESINFHPYLQDFPSKALEVALFRIRLLNFE